MPRQDIVVSHTMIETPRVQQLRGVFDLPNETESRQSWQVDLPLTERPWNIGLIVGHSGCGKSTIARNLWPTTTPPTWNPHNTIIDDFPDMPIKDIISLLCSVGFSSPPYWLRPFHVLSTGQQFRANLARLLAESQQRSQSDPIVVDEFTSVVDRTVATIGSAAVAKTIRNRNQQFIAVTCHEDVEPWLNPDWVYRPAENMFSWRLLQPRPHITLQIFRCHPSAWSLFSHHHYLNHAINNAAVCFLANWKGTPVAFSSWIHFVGRGHPTKREHRTVTLPDFQGVGLGNTLSDTIAAMWKTFGFNATSTTTHPAMIQARRRSPNWHMAREPSFTAKDRTATIKHATTRLTASFKYIGPPLSRLDAVKIYGSNEIPPDPRSTKPNLRLHQSRRLPQSSSRSRRHPSRHL